MTRLKRNHRSAGGHSGVSKRGVVRSASLTWCAAHNKRKYTSRSQALKAGEQKYGMRSNAYVCPRCATWHLTRRDTRLDPARQDEASANEAADRLVDALGITGGDE